MERCNECRECVQKSGACRKNKPRKPIIKKGPSKPRTSKNDIYITLKSDFKRQTALCEEILRTEEFVWLHCIGNAINRGINLALKLIENSGGALAYDAKTSTIELTDEFHPLNEEDDFTIKQRKNSCLHIKVFRILK